MSYPPGDPPPGGWYGPGPAMPSPPGSGQYGYGPGPAVPPLPGPGQYGPVPEPPPNNYFGLAIAAIATSVHCSGCLALPVGIVAMMNSNRVNQLWAQGDRAGAEEASRKAHTWAIATFWVVGISVPVLFVGWIALQVLVANAG